jgi:protein gp37
MSDQRNGGIAWTDTTWNPVRGCSRVSPGCQNCYAERVAARFSGEGQPYHGLAVMGEHGPRWTREVQLVVEHLADPLRWKRPRRVFVNSMSDLFHEGLKDEEIAAVFGIMGAASHHTFQVLTKRADRLRAFMTADDGPDICATTCHYLDSVGFERGCGSAFDLDEWPLPNVWIGVSVEDQQRANERIPDLLATPAAVRFLSVEPLLGPVDLREWLPGHNFDVDGIDWVIVGGESGPGARPFDVGSARAIVEQCRAAGVTVFMKQLGSRPRIEPAELRRVGWVGDVSVVDDDGWIHTRDRKGGDMSEWPADLRVQEFPR